MSTTHSDPDSVPRSDVSTKPENPPFLIPPHPLSTSRYQRQILVPSISIRGQEALSRAKVLIIGLGGLGSPASLYLAASGIGTLGLIDADAVETSNLHRQIVHTEAGAEARLSKVDSAIRTLRERNSEVRYVGYQERFEGGMAVEVVRGFKGKRKERRKVGDGEGGGQVGDEDREGEVLVEGGYDIVLDCTDNPATRYLISDVCVALGKVLVSGAAQRAEGQLMRLCYPPPISLPPSNPPPPTNESADGAKMGESAGNITTTTATSRTAPTPRGPCYRCIFPHPPPPETVQSCSEIGILGPVVGLIGTMMAMDTIKIIIDTKDTTTNATGNSTPTRTDDGQRGQGGEESQDWRPTLLLYNGLASDPKSMFRTVGLRRTPRRYCLACGDEEVLRRAGKRKITVKAIGEGGVAAYLQFCGSASGGQALGDEQAGRTLNRLGAEGFRDRIKDGDGSGGRAMPPPLVVDVREEVEYELGAKVHGSVNIPISGILRRQPQPQRLHHHHHHRQQSRPHSHSPHRGHGKRKHTDDDDDDDDIALLLKEHGYYSYHIKDKAKASDAVTHGNDHDHDHATDEQNNSKEEEAERTEKTEKVIKRPIYLICQRGNDSQMALRKLLDLDLDTSRETAAAANSTTSSSGITSGGDENLRDAASKEPEAERGRDVGGGGGGGGGGARWMGDVIGGIDALSLLSSSFRPGQEKY